MRGHLRYVWLGRVEYQRAWELQRLLAAQVETDSIDDVVLLLEHPPVYTMGRGGSADHLGAGIEALRELGADYAEVDRGGSVTFHGPGQLVAYPIVKLSRVFPFDKEGETGDPVRYLRSLEEALIATASSWNINAVVRPPHTGIWVAPTQPQVPWRKLAAIGVKLTHGVTTHGIALNVTTDLDWFGHVVACGIEDASVCSIQSLTRESPDLVEVGALFMQQLSRSCGIVSAPARLEPIELFGAEFAHATAQR